MNSNYNGTPPRSSGHGMLIGGVVLVVILLVVGIVWWYKSRSNSATADYATLVDATGAPVALVPISTDAPTYPPTAMPTLPPTPLPTFAPTLAPTTLSVSSVPREPRTRMARGTAAPGTAAPGTLAPATLPPAPLPGNPVTALGLYGIAPWGTTSNFTDPLAQWIWNAPGSAASAPANTVPINFSTAIVNATSAPLPITISAIVDNNSTVTLNGLPIGPANGGWTGGYPKLSAMLAPGTNVLTFAATNAGAGPNPAGVLASVADSAGNVLARTDATWVWS